MQQKIFNFDELSLIITMLVVFIGAVVIKFARSYLDGDRNYKYFLLNLITIIASIIICFSADDIFVFLGFFYLSNFFLVLLIIHKANWEASFQSGIAAAKQLLMSSIMVGAALYFLNRDFSGNSIQFIVQNSHLITDHNLAFGLLFLTLGAFMQSAIFPFNKWLLSSLNSPTPVSAVMHAGLINGGAILIARFANLYVEMPLFLDVIFVVGIVSCVLGTAFKLVQSDIKKMLACSTLSQMGFMFAQCGLGLFAAAIAHLCFHGLFKAYLFLTSNSSWQERKIERGVQLRAANFSLALAIGACGAAVFTAASGFDVRNVNSEYFLIFMTFIFAAQIAFSLLDKIAVKNFVWAMAAALGISYLYALSIVGVRKLLEPAVIFMPQELKLIHALAALVLFGLWIAQLLYQRQNKRGKFFDWLYVKILNMSQPIKQTITANRKNYRL